MAKKFNFDHAAFYKTCARARSFEEHKAPKNFALEHTKPLFKEHRLLTVHNLHKLFILNEIYKIQKYRYPLSLSTFLYKTSESVRVNRQSNLVVPNYRLNISRNQFLYIGTNIWNNVNSRVSVTGSDFLSDLSISSCVAKRRFKEMLINMQFSGDIYTWEKYNFHL